MIVRELFAKLGFKVDEKGLKQFESGLGQAKAGLKGLATVIAAGGASVLGLATSAAHAAEEVKDLAIQTGLSTEEFQRLSFAAGTTNVSAQELTASMNFLNRNMFMARKGSKEAMQAFAMLSPTVAKAVARGAPAGQVFGMIADAITKIQDPARKAALSMAVFGRGGARLLPILAKGSAGIDELGNKAEAMGLVFDDDAIEASEKFIKSLKTLGGIAKGIARVVGIGLVKAIQPFLDRMVEIRMETAELTASNLREFFLSIFNVARGAASFLFNLYKGVNLLLKPFGGLLGVAKGLVIAFTAWKALQLLEGIGNMTRAVYRLATTYQFLGNAGLIANAKVAALPILIGAAVALALLALEDLYVFLTDGGDSLIGVFEERFPRAFGILKGVIMGVWNVISPFLQAFNDAFFSIFDSTQSWWQVLLKIGNVFGELILTFTRLTGLVAQGLLGARAERTGSSFLGSLAQTAGQLVGVNMGNIGGFLGLGGGSGVAQNNQVSQSITVNVGERDDAATIAAKVGDASSTGLNDVLRQAGRNLAPGVAY